MRRLPKDEALAAIAAAASADGRCAMCALVEGGTPIEEGAHALVVLARWAVRRGHLLVVLREHVEAIERVDEAAWQEASRLAWLAARALAHVLSPVRTYVAALGTATPRVNSFPHVHQHVVPLAHGDARDRPAEVFTWERGVEVYEPGEAEALIDALRAAWPATRATAGSSASPRRARR